jgi:hypothetical protein
MSYKYFDITIKNDNLGEIFFTFYLTTIKSNGIIGKDDCSNEIIHDNTGVFIYINDAEADHDYIKLFDNLDDFYKNTEIYDQSEYDKRNLANEYEDEDEDEDDLVPACSMLISKFVKTLGGKRLIDKYKEGSYYNVTQAYIDGTITDDEFKMLTTLGMIVKVNK